ncbi:hypothetical protein AB0C10_05520 [Microbispora amethystogenes]|uniref:hypothetical protein n=1 Tax=Microbispora amethystogenes TaxID=1427754 RepID=UPI0033D8F9C8
MPITPASDTPHAAKRRAGVRPAAMAATTALGPALTAVRVAATATTLMTALVTALLAATVLDAGAATASARSRPAAGRLASHPADHPAGHPADAGDGNGNDAAVRVGNGSENQNMVTIGSTRIRGVLYQFSAGVGGVSSVQGGLCRPHGRVCVLKQKVRVSASEPPATARAGHHFRPRPGERRA